MDPRKATSVEGWQKKYRWARTWPGETGIDGKLHEDYVGYDGDDLIGRIYLDQQTLKSGRWRWAGGYPKGVRSPIMPNGGWLASAAEAACQVEDYWDAMKARLVTRP
ncbi:hypothetical protein [Shinella zoogloeoides]|uniref:hypothetical protein n=1 Tax=Shinella zoogloeoides TaxID=352475 RepID=UPI00273D2F3D|nr:hypothetical protein [Shinella zoogloeoides]WLR90951.1 hypothetical protein Q9316_00815 [Shinella zoogloeoides]